MKARAPGKLVLSGAYAVLEGAPAIVAAVDRYAMADTEQAAAFVGAELQAAIGNSDWDRVRRLWRLRLLAIAPRGWIKCLHGH